MSEPSMTTDVVGICRFCGRHLKWVHRRVRTHDVTNPHVEYERVLVDANEYDCDRRPPESLWGRFGRHELMTVDLADSATLEEFLADPIQWPYEPPF